MQSQLVSAHGMLAIMEILEGRITREVALKLLQLVNTVRISLPWRNMLVDILQLVTADMGFLESFCLIGYVRLMSSLTGNRSSLCLNRGIPVIMDFTSKKHSPECRLEASNFIRLLCHSSVLTLQMFISYVPCFQPMNRLATEVPVGVAVSRF